MAQYIDNFFGCQPLIVKKMLIFLFLHIKMYWKIVIFLFDCFSLFWYIWKKETKKGEKMQLFFKLHSSILTQPILEINLKKLVENYRLLADLSAPAIAAAVIKDDAYGIGAKEIVRVLYEKGGCKNFFAAHAFEAEQVVEFAPEAKFYILQGIGDDSLALFQKYGFVPVISSPEMLAFYKKHKKALLYGIFNICFLHFVFCNQRICSSCSQWCEPRIAGRGYHRH